MAADGEPLRIDVSQPAAVRVIFVAIGIFIITVAIYELWRGVWPPNVTSPFFLFMILGACSVGLPAIMAGLFQWSVKWEVRPGRIDIFLRNPFRRRLVRLEPANVLGLQVVEREAMEGDNTWLVQLTTSTERFQSQDFASREGAEGLLRQIEAAFRG